MQLPLLYTCIAKLLAPSYTALYWAATSSDAARLVVRCTSSIGASWVECDDFFFMVGLSLAVGLSYILGNGVFGVLDAFELLQEYRLPRTRAQAPPLKLIRRTFLKEFISHVFTGPAIMLFLAGPGLRAAGSPTAPSALPLWHIAWGQLAIQMLVFEFTFYFAHRLLHTEAFYLSIHKQHHAYIGTRSFAGEYAHVIEDIITAYIPFLAGLFLTRAHFHLVFVWFFIRVIGVAEGHSGYCFRHTWLNWIGIFNASSTANHDFHHTHNSGNFGSPWLDWLFGTMDKYMSIGGEAGYVEMARRTEVRTRNGAKLKAKQYTL